MPRSAPALLGILLPALLGVLPGCSVSSTYRPMTIEVRDATTAQPVEGAIVEARSLHLFLPVDLPIVGENHMPVPDRPRSPRGMTDADGAVRLEVVVDHPVQVFVSAVGFEPQVIDLPWHPAARPKDGPAHWLDADSAVSEVRPPRRLQVRFLR